MLIIDYKPLYDAKNWSYSLHSSFLKPSTEFTRKIRKWADDNYRYILKLVAYTRIASREFTRLYTIIACSIA